MNRVRWSVNLRKGGRDARLEEHFEGMPAGVRSDESRLLMYDGLSYRELEDSGILRALGIARDRNGNLIIDLPPTLAQALPQFFQEGGSRPVAPKPASPLPDYAAPSPPDPVKQEPNVAPPPMQQEARPAQRRIPPTVPQSTRSTEDRIAELDRHLPEL